VLGLFKICSASILKGLKMMTYEYSGQMGVQIMQCVPEISPKAENLVTVLLSREVCAAFNYT
jgi:hypothetical protein